LHYNTSCMMQKHLLITGGNGFLGKQICRLASTAGIPVVSISRTGKPKGIIENDFRNVSWIEADVFDPDTWAQHLLDCLAVIHCIGILEEDPVKGLTYQKMILESASIVGRTARLCGVQKFVYISAGAGAPETPASYMENKISAEHLLNSLGMELTILKPGMLYGDERPETIMENAEIQKLLKNPQIGPRLMPNRPLPVNTAARVALHAAMTPGFSGKLSVDDMEKLAAAI